MIHPDGEEELPDEFKRDAVALYRDTEDVTIAQIAGELGSHEATLTAWCRAAGVSILHRRSVARADGAGGEGETSEQELGRLRAENQQLRADKSRLA